MIAGGNFKKLPNGLIVVPMPKNPARFSVWDPTSDHYVAGLINVTRQKAELQGAKAHPANWQEVAKENGWCLPAMGLARPDGDLAPDGDPSPDDDSSLGDDLTGDPVPHGDDPGVLPRKNKKEGE